MNILRIFICIVPWSFRSLARVARLPELVFWNLAARALPGGPGAPALANDAGVVLMSGFSPQMLRDLMDPDTELKAAAADAKPKEKRVGEERGLKKNPNSKLS